MGCLNQRCLVFALSVVVGISDLVGLDKPTYCSWFTAQQSQYSHCQARTHY